MGLASEPATPTPIANLADLTPARLTAVLCAAGALDRGEVVSVALEPSHGAWSRAARVVPAYSAGSTGERPVSLWLKLSPADSPFGPSEVHYYARDYRGLGDAPIPRCYDAAYDASRATYHLLLEDLSTSHRNAHGLVPDRALAEAFGHAAGRLHAFRWGPERWADIAAAPATVADVDRYAETCAAGLDRLLAASRESLRPGQSDTLQRVFARYPAALRARAVDLRGHTVIHGDPNPGNLLLPRRWLGCLYLIDRQPFDWSLPIWLGAADLAYLLVHWWPTATRRAMERTVLVAYREALAAGGIAYPAANLWRDYRFCALQSLYGAAEWCTNAEDVERMRWVWERELRLALAAYDDLDLEEFVV